jgi:RNA polymerase sigma factor (TIGR02999 family)
VADEVGSTRASGDVTRLLSLVSEGDARSALFNALYRELRRLASDAMRAERSDHTLQPTALVHETYLRLAGDRGRFDNRSHFLGVAASAMRRVLIDHARGRNAQRRRGRAPFVVLDDLGVPQAERVDLVALDDALAALSSIDPRQARIVELRFFGGLSVAEAATVVGVSERTVKREWQMARAWLRREIARPPGSY